MTQDTKWLGRITDATMSCKKCEWTGTVGECEVYEPDTDGELACPECGEKCNHLYQ